MKSLNVTDATFMVRCHEYYPSGVHIYHDERVLSIFSSAPYCGNNNQGVFVTFEVNKEDKTAATFWKLDSSYPCPSLNTEQATISEVEGTLLWVYC